MWRFLYQRIGKVLQTNRLFLNSAISILSIMIWCFSTAFAQSNLSLTGQIYDNNDGSIIQNAAIQIIELGIKTRSDNFGFFYFENITTGSYSIKITAPGYNDTTLNYLDIKPDIVKRVIIKMSGKVYNLGKIVVHGKKPDLTSDRVTIISRNEIRQSHIRDVSEILETIEGVSIQKTGPSGESQVRIRGCDPGQVLVLIDGQKINASGSGVADLSGIPIDIIESIELHKGGAGAEFGADALAGAINIITRPTRLLEKISLGTQKGWGGWNTRSFELNLSNPIYFKNFTNRWFYLSNQTDGDFDFTYHLSDSLLTGTRLNNKSQSDNFFASGIYQPSQKVTFNYSGRYFESGRGLPDRAARQNETAAMTDRRKLLTSAFNYNVSDNHRLDIEIGYTQYNQQFLDIDTSQIVKYDSEFINDIYSITHHHSFIFLNGNLSRYSISYRDEKLNQTDRHRPFLSMGKTSRNNLSVYFSINQKADLSKIKLFDLMNLDAAVRYDISRTKKDSTSYADTVKTNSTKQLSPKFGLAFSKGQNILFILRTSYGKSFRLPTLNALFWTGNVLSSGNPGLKPEKSEHSEAGIEIKLDFEDISVSAGFTYFHLFIKDRVVWAPNPQGVWTPKNMAFSLTTGHEDFIHLSLLKDKIKISYQNTISTSINKIPGHNSYGKRLSFSPHYITTISARINSSPLFFSYSVRMVDFVYTNESNSRHPYGAYRLDDLRLGFNFDLSKSWKVSVLTEIDNIFDTSYELMANFPMPGRQWNIFIGINYNIGKENL